jgi:outer membrane protein TolC
MKASVMRSVLAGGAASFAFLFLTSHLSGQVTSNSNDVVSTSAVFSLDDIVREVLTNNPSLKAATANWLAMKERIPQARAWADRQHSAECFYGRKTDRRTNLAGGG